jgi:hypothetical protein
MDDFTVLRDSFRRDLRIRNRAPRTIDAYIESCDRLSAWARSQGLGGGLSWHLRHVWRQKKINPNYCDKETVELVNGEFAP